MKRAAITRTLTVAGASGIASLAFAAPASAMLVIPPDDNGTAPSTTQLEQPSSSLGGWDPTALGAGAAIAVAGLGTVVLVRRRHSAHAHAPTPNLTVGVRAFA